MIATDPVTGKPIEWFGPAMAQPHALPLDHCVDQNSLARWCMPWECPDQTAVLGTDLYVAGLAWQAANFVILKFDSNLDFAGIYPTGHVAGDNISDNLIGAMHRGTALATSPDDDRVEFVITTGQQGGATMALYTLASDGTVVASVGNLSWTGLTINSVGFTAATAAYMPKFLLTEDAKRIISGAFRTSDGLFHSFLLTNTSFATTGWTLVPLLYHGGTGGDFSTQVHQIASAGSGENTVIVATFGGFYGNDRFGLAFSLDDGSTWSFLAPEGAVAVPSGGMDVAGFEAGTGTGLSQSGWILSDDSKIYCPGRVLIHGTKAWVSVIRLTGSNPFQDLSGDTEHFILECDLDAGTYQLRGPFLTAQTGWFSAMDMQWKTAGSIIRCARAIPVTGRNPDSDVLDYPNGGPSMGIYEYDVAAPDTAPTLVQTLARPAGGSPYDYIDRVWGWYPYHEQSYGDGQVFIGWRWVKGADGKLAANISDMRPQGVYPSYHFSRMRILEVSE